MHVLFVNEQPDFVGGAERYIADTARMLRARGVRTTLFYGVGPWMEPSFTSLFDAALPMVSLARQVEELAPDLVYVHQLADPRAVLSIVGRGAPVVRFFHDHALFCLRDHKYTTVGHETCRRPTGAHCYSCLGFVNRKEGGGFRLRLLSELEGDQRANKGLDAYVVGSAYMRDHVAAHGFEASRIHVIPPFVEMPKEPAAKVERDPHRLLFVGALLRGKGIDILLKAMTEVPRPTRLRILGTGKQEDMFRRQVAELGLADRVYFGGRASREELEVEYRRAACVIVPSRAPETFGLTGPEALLRGTPVIASDVGGMGEWLHDGVTGLAFPSGDAGALATAIRRTLADPAEAQRLANAGRELCERKLRAEDHVDALMALFEQLTRPRAKREARGSLESPQ